MGADSGVEERRKARRGGGLGASPQLLQTQRERVSSAPLGRERERERAGEDGSTAGPGEKSRGFEAANHWGLLAALK